MHNGLNNTFSIYPNPTNGIIRFNSNINAKRIAIYNVIGKLVFNSENIIVNEIDISNFENGMYFLVLETDRNKTAKIKIIKE